MDTFYSIIFLLMLGILVLAVIAAVIFSIYFFSRETIFARFGLGWKSIFPDVQEKWIDKSRPENPKHQEILKRLTGKDYDTLIRKSAAAKITDKNVLKNIIKKDKDYSVRLVCYRNLNLEQSEAASKDIASHDEDEKIREAAVRRISDPDFLCKIALNDSSKSVSLAALSIIKDSEPSKVTERLLEDIARSNKSEQVCRAALSLIGDIKLLAKRYLIMLKKILSEKKLWLKYRIRKH